MPSSHDTEDTRLVDTICWETIAEFIYEVRSDGPHCVDAIGMLTVEANHNKELERIVCRATQESPPFTEDFLLRNLDCIFAELQTVDMFFAEQKKMIIDRLLGTRDA